MNSHHRGNRWNVYQIDISIHLSLSWTVAIHTPLKNLSFHSNWKLVMPSSFQKTTDHGGFAVFLSEKYLMIHSLSWKPLIVFLKTGCVSLFFQKTLNGLLCSLCSENYCRLFRPPSRKLLIVSLSFLKTTDWFALYSDSDFRSLFLKTADCFALLKSK